MTQIRDRLLDKQTVVSRVALYKLWRRYQKTGNIADMPKAQPGKKLGREQCSAIDEALVVNDELTSRQLREILEERWPGIDVSLRTVKRACKKLGWIASKRSSPLGDRY